MPSQPPSRRRARTNTGSASKGAGAREVPVGRLRRLSRLDRLGEVTSSEIEPFAGVLGQPRAEAALALGLGMQAPGYNIFVLGAEGTGRHFLVRHFVTEAAAARPKPSDWCYVFNFDQPNAPRVLELPAGRGIELRQQMFELVESLQAALLGAFQSEEYQTRKEVIEQELRERQEQALAELGEEAKQRSLAVVRTPMGIIFAPVAQGEVLTPDLFEKLSEEEKQRYTSAIEELQEKMQRMMRQAPRWQAERRGKLQELRREVTRFTVEPLIDELKARYPDLPNVCAHLEAVQADIETHVKAFLGVEEGGEGQKSPPAGESRPATKRYLVNLLVDNQETEGAPVIWEENPTFANLVGRIEHQAQMGNLVTDFTLIRAGALHRANGGFLVLDALRLLRQPYGWDALKRAIETHRLRLESAAEALGLAAPATLAPEPVPLDVKIVLVGDRLLYYLLTRHDLDFHRLFKVAADFEESLPRTEENELLYTRLLAKLIRDEQLRPFAREALERLLEQSARLADDGERLSLHTGEMVDLLREADLLAGPEVTEVKAAAVDAAVAARVFRCDRVRARWLESVARGTVLVETGGAVPGQVNGLAVVQLGSFAFGHPARITARVRLGEGEVVNIEREVELSGPLHSKGVLILTGFLGDRFARERPLAFSASLVFEQSYGGIDGDSASMAELCALLSAIADVPLRQSVAITGSVDQRGRAQPIGGVNEKIEGFFDVCRLGGLTGEQGVIVPESNLEHLMLRADVVAAVAAGQFRIWAVRDVDDCLETLSGLRAGKRGPKGEFPAGSFNRRVEERLAALAELKAEEARKARRSPARKRREETEEEAP